MNGRIVIPKEYRALLNPDVRAVVEDSGRTTGKSTTNENLAVKLALENGQNNTLYMRAEGRDLADIYNSTVATIQSLEAEDLFDFRLSPYRITCRTGATIYFRAVNGKTKDDLTATKGFVPQGRTLALAIIDEAQEVKCYNHIVAAKTTADKFLLPYGKMIYAYNPPIARTHWANIEFPRIVREGATRIHTTWESIKGLLKPATIEEIEHMRENDPLHYAYWYGGEIVNLEGAVIWSFDRTKHLLPLAGLQRIIGQNIFYQPLYMFYGVDSGITSDATAVSAWGIYPDGKLIKLGTMYLDIARERCKTGLKGISHTDQVLIMYDWYNTFRKRMSDYGITIPDVSHERWCFDGAALTQDLMLEWRKATGFKGVAVTDKDKERDNARLVNSYKSGMLLILDTPDNQVSVEELENFSYDDNNEIPEGQSDHTIDADKYATYEYYYNFI